MTLLSFRLWPFLDKFLIGASMYEFQLKMFLFLTPGRGVPVSLCFFVCMSVHTYNCTSEVSFSQNLAASFFFSSILQSDRSRKGKKVFEVDFPKNCCVEMSNKGPQ